MILIQDVTKRIEEEEKLKKVNRELTLLNEVNNLILKHQCEEELLSNFTNLLISFGGYKLCWIGKKPSNANLDQVIKPLYAAGKLEYLKDLEICLNDNLHTKGPTATVLRFGVKIVTNNTSDSADFKPWLPIAQKHQISASLVLPFSFGDDSRGCINLYSEKTNVFTDAEILSLERIISNISQALKNIRNIEEKEKSSINLNERVKELRTIYKVSSELQNENRESDEVLLGIVNHIPQGWEFPDLCSAKIQFDGKDFLSNKYNEEGTKQIANFKTLEGKAGSIIVTRGSYPKSLKGDLFVFEKFELLNKLAGMLAMYFNRKALLSGLKKSEANLKSVFENTGVGQLLLDKNTIVVDFNQTFYDNYLKVSNISINRGISFISQLLDEKKQIVIEAINNIKETRNHQQYETTYSNNDTSSTFKISLAPILETDAVVGFCMTAVDITERIKQGSIHQKLVQDLTIRNRELEQFAYIVSHNVRSPLANILGLTNLFSNTDGLSEDIKYGLSGIQIAAEKLDDVLTDLNQTLDTRKKNSEINTFIRFEDLMKDIQAAISDQIKSSNARIYLNFEEVDSIFSIRAYFYSIFYNIITNSIKYALPGVQPRIDVWSERKEGKIILHFSDNGKGIDLEKYGSQIFGMYKRFELNVEGKGLGLFMVKTQAEALIGSVAVQSSPGKGSHFILSFDQ